MENQTSAQPIDYDRLSELERYAEIGRLNAGLLHEISNPLAAASLWLEQCRSKHSPHLRHVRSNIRTMQRYVEAARQQVRGESSCRDFRLQPELEQVRRLLDPLAQRRGVRLRFTSAMPAATCKLYGDPVKFQQIIANLVRNAIDSYITRPMQGSGNSVQVRLDANRDFVTLKISDQGSGMSGGQLARLFQPFYSTKYSAGRGLGIGLSTVKRYIETDFLGDIRVNSVPRQGTQFTVRLPRKPQAD